MSTGGVIAVVLGGLAVLYIALNRGLISAGVQVPVGVGGQRGIVAPQPAQNYGGYLAATTAPQVSNLLGTAISGLNNAFSAWLRPSAPPQQAPQQGATANAPSLFAQPSGPNVSAAASAADVSGGWMIGPNIDPTMSYSSTSGAAFDYGGLSFDNSFDPGASLDGLVEV